MLKWETAATGVEDLDRRVRAVEAVLTSGSFFPISEEERQSLWSRAQEIRRKLHQLEEGTLLIGLVGGTGVGKSTLMNALAQDPIASVSHRRPHTDRVLLYRHARCAVPTSLRTAGNGLFNEVVHEAEAVRHVIMADLPDVDSLVQEHRERALRFMEHLDLVLWVTTPEKYADGRFYDVLRAAPKARENFAFVLNKADIFFPGPEGPGSLGDLEKVVHSFRRLVREAGVPEPMIYVISAQEVLTEASTSPWNQFPFLRHWVFQERDAKEIRAIKEANLDVEFHALVVRLREGLAQLENAIRYLKVLESALLDPQRFGNSALLARRGVQSLPTLGENLAESLYNPEDLSGASAVLAWLSRMGSNPPAPSHAVFHLAREVSTELNEHFQEYMAAFREYGAALAFQEGLMDPLRAELLGRLQRSFENISVREQTEEMLMTVMAQAQRRGETSVRRRQRTVSVVITVLLLFALGGREGWRAVTAEPGVAQFVGLCAAVVEKLFSGQGLAALGTWAVLQLVLGGRFYREYKKSLQRRGEAIIDSLQSALEQVLRQALEQIVEVIRQCRKEMEDRMTVMELLGKSGPFKDAVPS